MAGAAFSLARKNNRGIQLDWGQRCVSAVEVFGICARGDITLYAPQYYGDVKTAVAGFGPIVDHANSLVFTQAIGEFDQQSRIGTDAGTVVEAVRRFAKY